MIYINVIRTKGQIQEQTKGIFSKERDEIILNITSGRKKDGKTIPFDIAFNLSKVSMI